MKLRTYETVVRGVSKLAALALTLAVAAAMMLGVANPAKAQTATFTVDTLDNRATAGETCTSAPNDCTLRDAVDSTNASTGADTIIFESGLNGTIALTEGEITVSGPVDIQGPGADQITVDAEGDSRVFFVLLAGVVSISDLTLTNGQTPTTVPNGGAVLSLGSGNDLTLSGMEITDSVATESGGGVASAGLSQQGTAIPGGELTITNSTISGNTANGNVAGGQPLGGGGIGTFSDTDLENVTVSDNRAPAGVGGGIAIAAGESTAIGLTVTGNTSGFSGGGIASIAQNLAIEDFDISDNTTTGFGSNFPETSGFGGGVFNGDTAGDIQLTDGVLSGNTADFTGGGMSVADGQATITEVTIDGNEVLNGDVGNGGGGGLRVSGGADGADLIRSTVSNNISDRDAGGILNFSLDFSAVNSTISGNEAGRGGGIANGFGNIVDLLNVTITDNGIADGVAEGANVFNSSDDMGNETPGVIEASNTIISDPRSTGDNCIGSEIISNGFNLDSGDSCGFDESSDIENTDPLLDTLGNYGGSTATHALSKESPAVDQGNTDLTTDQRSEDRPSDFPDIANATGGDGSDIGAFELQDEVEPPTDPNACTIRGTSGDDELSGTPGRDVICGLGGNDTIRGLEGNDLIRGGEGDDTVFGGPGSDTVYSGPGNDTIISGDGNDRVFGGDGRDRIEGGAGTDTLDGQGGDDTIFGGDGKDLIRGGEGNDSLRGQAGDDTISGGPGNDELTGGPGRDRLDGGPGKNTVTQ